MARTSFTTGDILIVVKTYPNPSKKYIESSCTVGLTREREWLRIYPVPFRMLQDSQQFKKYQWIRGRIKKSVDPRPESHKIDFDSIQLLDEILPATDGWAHRRAFLEPVKRESLEEIQHEQELSNISLGFFRPKSIEELIIEPTSEFCEIPYRCFTVIPLFANETARLATMLRWHKELSYSKHIRRVGFL